MPKAALFDMDRTLVRKVTGTLYARHQRSVGKASWADVARMAIWMTQHHLGQLDFPEFVRKNLEAAKAMPESSLARMFEEGFESHVKEHVADAGRHAVRYHQARGEIVAIVTGTHYYATAPLARMLGIEHVVATELEFSPARRLTGRYIEPLCYGPGKIDRAQRLAERLGFELAESTFYADSITDLPLLERVAHPVAVNPDAKLLAIARERGWPIEHW